MDRRTFIKIGGALTIGTALGQGFQFYQAVAESGGEKTSALAKNKWGMLINLTKCDAGCTACVDACRKENNVPLFGDKERDIHWIRKAAVKQKFPNAKEQSVPLLCNHCENPACVQVCPTMASFVRKDGIVLVDKHRCIGCRYCMIACPYKARSFVFKETHDWTNKDVPKRMHGVVEKCDLCVHRIDKGQKPACVEACANANKGAMVFGDLNDPESEISKLIANNAVQQIRADLGLKPKVYYIGL